MGICARTTVKFLNYGKEQQTNSACHGRLSCDAGKKKERGKTARPARYNEYQTVWHKISIVVVHGVVNTLLAHTQSRVICLKLLSTAKAVAA